MHIVRSSARRTNSEMGRTISREEIAPIGDLPDSHGDTRYCFEPSDAQIQKIYHPIAHGTIEEEWNIIRAGTAALFKGEATLPLSIKEIPSDPKMTESQGLVLQRLANAYTEEGALRVSMSNGEVPQAHTQRPAA